MPLPREPRVAVVGATGVDDVEVGRAAAVHPDDHTIHDDELWLGIVRPIRGDEPELGERRDELLEVKIARRARGEAAASHGARSPRSAYATAASRTKAAVFEAS